MPHKRQKRALRDANTKAAGYDNAPTASDSLLRAPAFPSGSGPLAPAKANARRKKVLPKDKLNSFGGREDLGGLPKSMHRILNASKVREEYNAERKRKRDEEEGKINPQGKKSLAPLPYESLSAFNRRVEISLRPSIDTAIRHSKASSAKAKLGAKKGKEKEKDAEASLDPEDPNYDHEAPISSGNQKKGKVATAAEAVDPHAKKVKVRTGPTEFEEASQRKSVADVVQAPPTLKKARRGVAPTTRAEQALPAHRQPVSESIRLMMEQEREKAIRQYRELKERREFEQQKEK